jgi:hypothetical protein
MPLSVSRAANRPAALVVGAPPAALRRGSGLSDCLQWLDVDQQDRFAGYHSLCARAKRRAADPECRTPQLGAKG